MSNDTYTRCFTEEVRDHLHQLKVANPDKVVWCLVRNNGETEFHVESDKRLLHTTTLLTHNTDDLVVEALEAL